MNVPDPLPSSFGNSLGAWCGYAALLLLCCFLAREAVSSLRGRMGCTDSKLIASQKAKGPRSWPGEVEPFRGLEMQEDIVCPICFEPPPESDAKRCPRCSKVYCAICATKWYSNRERRKCCGCFSKVHLRDLHCGTGPMYQNLLWAGRMLTIKAEENVELRERCRVLEERLRAANNEETDRSEVSLELTS